MRAFTLLLITCCLSGFAYSQSVEPKPEFEIADVHVSKPTRNPFLRGPMLRRGLYEMRFATMAELVSKAYGLDTARVIGGPNWVENDTFDLIAKTPAGTTAETAKPMLQALLAERFGLAVHKDTKPVPSYALKAGKHVQMKEGDGSGESGCKFNAPTPTLNGAPMTGPPVFAFNCKNMTMAALADAFRTSLFVGAQYLNDRVVVDETELKGTWNFEFKVSPRGMVGLATADQAPISLFDAVEKLGLKLVPADIPVSVVVIDQVNQKPTPNKPNAAEVLHVAPPPTEFEVATVKPTDPAFRGMRLQIQPGGRVNIAGLTMKFIIQQAWDFSDEMLVGAPKWFDTERFDIVGKAAMTGPDMDIDDLWLMLRSLVTERFKMTSHTETREVSAYTLSAGKPKMKKADPASHTKYKEGPGSDGKDPRDRAAALSRLVTCQNMTMAQFAEKLKRIAPGYIHAPVLDATGLEGGYDFTFSFSPVGLTGSAQRPAGEQGAAGASAVPTAADPSAALTLSEAIDKQLGLKLEAHKRPVTVMVIDHVEEKPTEN